MFFFAECASSPIVPPCSSDGNWTISPAPSHAYNAANTYTITVVAKNSVSNTSKSFIVIIQDPIDNFSITYPTSFQYYPYQTSFFVAFAAKAGTGTRVGRATIDGNSILGNELWDPNTLSGNITVLPSYLNNFVGPKTLQIIIMNKVAPFKAIASYNCQIEYMFTNFVYTMNPQYLVTGQQDGTLYFTWSNASYFNYSIDFRNGNPPITTTYTNTIIDTDNVQLMNYSYPDFFFDKPGIYVVKIQAINDVDSQPYYINVTVQNPVCCIDLVNVVVGVLTAANGPGVPCTFGLFWTNSTALYPTDAVYDFQYGENGGSLTGEPFLPQQKQTQKYTYNQYNTYTVTVTIHNLISSLTLSTVLVIVVGFENVQFDMQRLQPYVGTEPHNYYLITNEVAQFTMTLSQGTNYNLTMDFNDTLSYTTSSVNDVQISYNRRYANAGQYLPLLTLRNAMQNKTALLPIPNVPNAPVMLVVQDPIQCFDYNISSKVLEIPYNSQKSGANLTLQIFIAISCNLNVGTNPRYSVIWGDSTAITNGSMGTFDPTTNNFNVNLLHNYATTNLYNLQITVWNEVSNQSFVTRIDVYNAVTNVTVMPTYLDDNGLEHQGFYAVPNTTTPTLVYFPIEYPVIFRAHVVFGSYLSYDWVFSDQYQAGPNSTIMRNFPDHGTYHVSVSISNQPTYGNTSLTIIIERSLKDLTISDPSPWPRYRNFTYTISIGSVPTDACYYFNFIDASPNASCPILYMGNLKTCDDLITQYNSGAPPTGKTCQVRKDLSSSSLENQQTNGSPTAQIIFNHTFYTLGRKNISLKVVNHVDSQTFYYSTYVTSVPCQFPKVTVRDLNRCLNSDNCKCFQSGSRGNNFQCPSAAQDPTAYLQGDRIGYMKDQILFNADVSVVCGTAGIWYNWTAQELDVTGKFIRSSTYLLNGLDYHSFQSKILTVPPTTIPGGRYHFTLTVKTFD